MLSEHTVEGGNQRDVRVRGGMDSDRDIVPFSLEKLAAQGRLGVSESDGVDNTVQLFHSEIAQLLRQSSELVSVGDIEFEYLWHWVKPANSSTGDADGTRQVRNDNPGALILRNLSRLKSDGGVHRHACDEDGASFKKSHGDVLPDRCGWM